MRWIDNAHQDFMQNMVKQKIENLTLCHWVEKLQINRPSNASVHDLASQTNLYDLLSKENVISSERFSQEN